MDFLVFSVEYSMEMSKCQPVYGEFSTVFLRISSHGKIVQAVLIRLRIRHFVLMKKCYIYDNLIFLFLTL